ncbi:MAG TPA: hypothetical protein VF470_08845 [Sphingomicrobium sp.]|jgi:hypothetical protein
MILAAYALLLMAPEPQTTATASAKPPEPTLEQVRAATERFKDVKVALAEGYVRDPMDECVTASMVGYPSHEGTMGVHYIRMDLLGIKGPPNPRVTGNSIYTDFNKPAVLIYEPQADGSVQLVAVENLVFQKAWHDAGNKARPTFQGKPYNYMADDPTTKQVDEGHMFEPHYDLHVWLYRDNPGGMFAQFNPDVSCAAHKHAHAETAAK